MRNHATDNQLPAGSKGIAILLAIAICWALVLACSEPLHKLVHPDAHYKDHQCAVTLVINGGLETLSITLLILFTALTLIHLLSQTRQQQISADRSNLHARAPPLIG